MKRNFAPDAMHCVCPTVVVSRPHYAILVAPRFFSSNIINEAMIRNKNFFASDTVSGRLAGC